MAGPLNRRRLSIGKLRHRVRIERRVSPATRDDFGAEVETWETLPGATAVFCKVQAMSGGEKIRSQTVQANVSHVVEMRQRTGIAPAMRLVWLDNNGAVLNVTAVLPALGFDNVLEIHCLQET